jgi:hypothetical protein
LRYRYSENAEAGFLEATTYSVEEMRPGHSSLYRSDFRGHRSEWVEGVKQLKVERFPAPAGQGSEGLSLELVVTQAGLTKTEYRFLALRNQSG